MVKYVTRMKYPVEKPKAIRMVDSLPNYHLLKCYYAVD